MPAKPKPPKITGKAALVSVLEANGNKPMKTKELTAKAAELAKATLRGKTPQATPAAVLATENAKPDGLFERTAPGQHVPAAPQAKPPRDGPVTGLSDGTRRAPSRALSSFSRDRVAGSTIVSWRLSPTS